MQGKDLHKQSEAAASKLSESDQYDLLVVMQLPEGLLGNLIEMEGVHKPMLLFRMLQRLIKCKLEKTLKSI